MTNENHEMESTSSELGIGTAVDGDAVASDGQPRSETTAECCEAEPAEKPKKVGKIIKLTEATPEVDIIDVDGCEAPVSAVERLRRAARDDYELTLIDIIEELLGIAHNPLDRRDHDPGEACRPGRLFQIVQGAMEVLARYRQVDRMLADSAFEEISCKSIATLRSEFLRLLRPFSRYRHPLYAQQIILVSQEILKLIKGVTRLRMQGKIDLEPIGNDFEENRQKEWELLLKSEAARANSHGTQQQEVAVMEAAGKTDGKPPLCHTSEPEITMAEMRAEPDAKTLAPRRRQKKKSRKEVLVHA